MYINMVLYIKLKKKNCQKKKIYIGKIVMCLYMWFSELGYIYLFIQLDGLLFLRCFKF